jgi:UMF1 family MFS transporter
MSGYDTADTRKVLSWALYDWGNSAFATTVMAGFFPLFFKQYWSAGVAVTESTFYLGGLHCSVPLPIAVPTANVSCCCSLFSVFA